MVNDIDKLSKRYARQELLLTAALFLITLLVMRVWYLDELLVPVIVSAVGVLPGVHGVLSSFAHPPFCLFRTREQPLMTLKPKG